MPASASPDRPESRRGCASGGLLLGEQGGQLQRPFPRKCPVTRGLGMNTEWGWMRTTHSPAFLICVFISLLGGGLFSLTFQSGEFDSPPAQP